METARTDFPWLDLKWIEEIAVHGDAVTFWFLGGRRFSVMRQSIVMTCGNFDPLHLGHVDLFHSSKRHGSFLVVGVDEDSAVKKQKGRGRPTHPVEHRLAMVAGCNAVDAVYLQEGGTSEPWVQRIVPFAFTKGSDRCEKTIPEAPICERLGIRLVVVQRRLAYSSRKLIEDVSGTV